MVMMIYNDDHDDYGGDDDGGDYGDGGIYEDGDGDGDD